jgi:hypothetical protein
MVVVWGLTAPTILFLKSLYALGDHYESNSGNIGSHEKR